MKRMTKIAALLMALVMMLMMSQAVFAEPNEVYGGTFTYDGGKEIAVTDAEDISEAINNMEPGDTLTITQKYVNDSDNKTEWYLKNDVVKSLERESKASGGGYTYILTSGGTEIFNSDRVGGSDAPDVEGEEGLELATDSTDEWIHIDTLKANGDSGETTLYVALDGETQANSYQVTDGAIDIQYAVEDEEVKDVIVHKPGKRINTGDSTNLLIPVISFIGSLLLLILAILSHRKDRKDGEEA